MKTESILSENIKDMITLTSGVFPACYNVTEENLAWSIFGSPTYNEKLSCLCRNDRGEVIGFIVVKSQDESGICPNEAWISSMAVRKECRRKGIGKSLLSRLINELKGTDISMLHLAGDFENLFSGIPNPGEENLSFFEKMGFIISKDDHFDLEGDVRENELIENYDHSFVKGYNVSCYNGDRDGLLSFLKKEFPGRWHFEVETALNCGKDSREINILLDNSNRVLGFCMTKANPEGLSGLGPIGIAESIRGKKLGEYLLWASLLQLRHLGAGIVNIDWTILDKFYGRFGFSPARRYRGGYLQLKG